MEELQDAIEDAQYVNAIATQEEGPRPVLSWEIPQEEQLAEWEETKRTEGKQKDPTGPEVLGIDWCLKTAIGFYLFSEFLKENCDDYLRINFIEDVIQWRRLRGKQRLEKAKRIIERYLNEPPIDSTTGKQILPEKIKIVTYDVYRNVPKISISDDDFKNLHSMNKVCISNDSTGPGTNCLGISGPVLNEINRDVGVVEANRNSNGSVVLGGKVSLSSNDALVDKKDMEKATESLPDRQSVKEKFATMKQLTQSVRNRKDANILNDLFIKVDIVIIESLRKQYWEQYIESESYTKMKNFLWFYDRPVVADDFFSMRVLGRGGFGSVTACKKGTSGKLYAMKVMNKKRIKLKKSEVLTVNEQQALAAVESPFVVNLKYSFHSSDDVFLILDLMTGGDLSYHLHQKGSFPQKECKYYAARIMLGLQALHDQGYVYRDLKPENCLLAEDGRVKLTDLGLATKITPNLHGAAGTRGYWAPEMLRRDHKGRRLTYDHAVDWFSFGCCVAEFISGANPFRSQAALKFGLDAGKESKEKAIDYATLEMTPEFPESLFEPDAADLCRRLLDKNEDSRLGSKGCEQIMAHPWFKSCNWETIISDRKTPPYIPPKDVNAASQSEIGTFAEDKKYHECMINEEDEKVYTDWDWTNPHAFAAEVLEFLIYERDTGKPLVPLEDQTSCCCNVM